MQIQSPEIGLRLAKFLKSYGPVLLGSVEEVVFPVVIIGDISKEGTKERVYAAAAVQAQNVTNGTRLRVVNPPTSGVNMWPRNIRIASGATAFWIMQIESSSGVVVGVLGQSLSDPSGAAVSVSTCGVTTDTPAGVAAATGAYFVGNTTSTFGVEDFSTPERSILIPPGRALAFYSNIINVEGRIGVWWTEETI